MAVDALLLCDKDMRKLSRPTKWQHRNFMDYVNLSNMIGTEDQRFIYHARDFVSFQKVEYGWLDEAMGRFMVPIYLFMTFSSSSIMRGLITLIFAWLSAAAVSLFTTPKNHVAMAFLTHMASHLISHAQHQSILALKVSPSGSVAPPLLL
jgi:hypothetical protein